MTLTGLVADHWLDVENDLHDCYGINVHDLGPTMRWTALRKRIFGVVSKPGTRTAFALTQQAQDRGGDR